MGIAYAAGGVGAVFGAVAGLASFEAVVELSGEGCWHGERCACCSSGEGADGEERVLHFVGSDRSVGWLLVVLKVWLLER